VLFYLPTVDVLILGEVVLGTGIVGTTAVINMNVKTCQRRLTVILITHYSNQWNRQTRNGVTILYSDGVAIFLI